MRLLALALCTAVFSLQPAAAGPATETLVTCVKDNTTGKDRKEIARWVFLAMSAHPEIQGMWNASTTARTDSDKFLASLTTRLLTENCRDQARAAIEKDGGGEALVAAFRSLGEVAMVELMQNKNVDSAVNAYLQYLDMSKLKSALDK